MENLLSKGENKNDFSCFLVIILTFFIIFQIFNNYYMVVQVDGSSMNNTLQNGDVLIVSKNYEIERGDVIVFDKNFSKLIKRVIAVEGDQIYCENGVVYIKKADETTFSELTEDYARGKTYDFQLVTVQSGYVFVLGDNREVSQDSRAFGCVLIKDVNGEVSSLTIKCKSFLTFLLGWSFDLNKFLWR